jgi:flagellar M-ring protein FliF
VRSQQTSESNQPGQATPSGVPGAATNQPTTPATAPINGASAPLQAAQGGTSTGAGRREVTTNYEVDKTVRVIRNATGLVKRLNVAVVVNHRSTTDAKGKTTTQPLTQDELDKITALVQEAMGFNKDRGDSVKVINAPFQVDKLPPAEVLPLWQQPWLLDLLRAGAVPGALALVALGLIFGVVKPTLKQALTPPALPAPDATTADTKGGQLDAVVDDITALPGVGGLPGMPALEAPKDNAQLEAARQLARDNPAAVANIMRDWVSGAAAA